MSNIVTPPSSGDITVRGMVADVINATWNLGLAKQADYEAKITAAQTDFLGTAAAPNVSAGSVTVPSITAPGVTIPASQSTGDVISMFDTKYLELVQLLVDKFNAFRTSFFPDEGNAYLAAEDWLQAAIANPSAGLPASIVAQIWGDDQARILEDASRAADSVVAQFAARRFPLPPGAAASAVMQIQQKAQDEQAESSRKVAILSVELQKFNVEKILGLRQMAMQEAVEYIKALASGPDMASKLIGVGYDAQSKLISAAADFYRADAQAKDVVSKIEQYNNSTQLEAAVKNQQKDIALIEDKLKALLAEAQAIAQMATSLFNNVHVQAGVSASRNAQVGYSYSNDTAGVASTITDVG